MLESLTHNYWLFFAGSAIVLLFIWWILYKYVFKIFYWVAGKTPSDIDDRIAQSLHKPLPTFLFISGMYYVFSLGGFAENIDKLILEIYKSSIIVGVFWVFHRFIHTYEENSNLFPLAQRQLYAPYFIRLLKVVFTASAIYLVLEQWGFDLSKLLAGIGITGIAFAFAARDTFANIFSGMVVVIEKPFSIGDVISTDKIDGTIIDINFRSTTVRTLEHTEIVVPNSHLVNTPLINKTKAEKRKIEIHLGIEGQDIDTDLIENKLRSLLDSEHVQVENALFKITSIHPNIVFMSIEAYSTLPAGELLKYKQAYLKEVKKAMKEQRLNLYYLGFEKYVPLDK